MAVYHSAHSKQLTSKLLLTSIIFITLFISLFSHSVHASDESESVDAQKYLVGTYSGMLGFKTPVPIEIALWFTIKDSKYDHAEVSGTMITGKNKAQCTYKLKHENFYHKETTGDYPVGVKQSLKNLNNPVYVSYLAEPALNDSNCFVHGLLKRRQSFKLTFTLAGGDNKRFTIDFSQRNNRSGRTKSAKGKLVRSSPSKPMEQLILTAKKLQLETPNLSEMTMLEDSKQKLTPDLASNLVVKGCSDFYAQTRNSIEDKGIDRIITFPLNDDLFIRISKKNEEQYIEHKITTSDQALLSSIQWQALTLASDKNYAGDNGCVFADAHKIASAYGLIEKYSRLPTSHSNHHQMMTKSKDIFIVEKTGIDVVRTKTSISEENIALRRYGVTGIFRSGDFTRKFIWSDKLQKATSLSYYKDFHSDKNFAYKEDTVEAIFTPVDNAIEHFGGSVFTLIATNPSQYQVCPIWQGEEASSTCPQKINSVGRNQLFVTHSEKAALTLYQELSPQAKLLNAKKLTYSHSKNCLTKAYCNFSASDFIIAIYNNNYGEFKKQNEQYTSAIVDRYKDLILVTNAIIKSTGVKQPKENTLNLFPYFAEYYLHLFDQKYPDCDRSQQKLSIRSDTKAYSIVNQYGNTVEKQDSVALYSDYNIPTSLVSMCNKICAQAESFPFA
ncbi:hypothetical protein ACPUVO_06000 [Pseudocolwellia sp. HL-MZ19]|uniref:hypothetical protein n=1 Tax=Pseudocolwellia sp. HL-MZ19 TaxID=3400846 RepID=UPI003CF52692